MRFEPLFPLPLWVIAILALLLVCAVALRGALRDHNRGLTIAWFRRVAMVLVIATMGLGPAMAQHHVETYESSVEVYFVIDRTDSMVAEDYNGSKPRLDGVKADIAKITTSLVGARFSIISFDSVASQQLPLTSDSRAVTSWIDTLKQQQTLYSSGSLIDRPLSSLKQALEGSAKQSPSNTRLVYFFSDGENTSDGTPESYAGVAQYLSGGAVLGYGTAAGGKMKVYDPSGATSGYIKDTTQSGSPDAISTIDESQLQTVATQLGVPYLHRTAPGGLESVVSDVAPTLKSETATRTVTTYQLWIWPFAAVLAALLLWEAAGLSRNVARRVGVTP